LTSDGKRPIDILQMKIHLLDVNTHHIDMMYVCYQGKYATFTQLIYNNINKDNETQLNIITTSLVQAISYWK